jgi:large subunit ribosomal protein L22
MSTRKKIAADQRKEERKLKSFAILRNCPTSPRKMRYVVDMIRGQEVNRALDILKFSKKEAAVRVEKLLKSAIANWQKKNEGERLEDNTLMVSEVKVDSGRVLRRLRTAPQGRGYRMLKRSNHVTLVVDKMQSEE